MKNIIQQYKKKYQCTRRDMRNLKCILLTELSHSEIAANCMIPSMSASGKGKRIEIVKRSVTTGRVGWVRLGKT